MRLAARELGTFQVHARSGTDISHPRAELDTGQIVLIESVQASTTEVGDDVDTSQRIGRCGGEPLDAVDSISRYRPLELTAQECRWIIHRGLPVLSQEQRLTIALTAFEDASLREVAAELNRPLGSVRHYYYRGLERLRVWAQADLNEDSARLTPPPLTRAARRVRPSGRRGRAQQLMTSRHPPTAPK